MILSVPKGVEKRLLKSEIRRYFEEKFCKEEKNVKIEVQVVNDSCYLHVAEPVLEYSPMGRLQFHDSEELLRYELVPGRGASVREG